MSLRIVFIGCVESSRAALEALLALPSDTATIVGVITRRASSFNADFVDLFPLVQDRDIPLLYAEDAADDDAQADWIESQRADVVFCIGWSRLLGPRVLAAAPRGIVGFHPAALPANRGRHPIIWALALGLDETASSFFLMSREPDSGPLLDQRRISIARTDNAGSLYAKILNTVRVQVADVALGLANGTLQPRDQDHRLANCWRRRSESDGQIDWRMGAQTIHNLVRALARPYPGAHFVGRHGPAKVWRSEVSDEGRPNLEAGKVLAVDGRCVLVKCGSHSIRLLEHEMSTLPQVGDYL